MKAKAPSSIVVTVSGISNLTIAVLAIELDEIVLTVAPISKVSIDRPLKASLQILVPLVTTTLLKEVGTQLTEVLETVLDPPVL